MKSSTTSIAVADLKFDESIYPRQNVDEHHVKQMCYALEGGITLPPIIVEKKTKRIVDGVHRYHAVLRREAAKIECILKAYANETELFREAVMLNTGFGLRLGTDDTLKVIQISEHLGIKEIDQCAMLRTSISHLRALKPRFATFEETIAGVTQLRKVTLKGSTRHLSGKTITQEQVDAMTSSPGQSYLLTCRQLISACENDLLPERSQHPTLWAELEVLCSILQKLLRKKAA